MKKFIAFAFILTVAALAVGYMAGRDDLLSDWGIELTPAAEGASSPVEAPGPIQVLAPTPPSALAARDDASPAASASAPGSPGAPVFHPVTPVDPGGEGPAVELSPLGADWTAEEVVVLFETHESPSPSAGKPPAPAASAPGKAVGLRAYLERVAKPHTVRPGDVLSRLGRRYQVPWGLLMRINGMKTPDLMAGAVIRVVQGPFAVRVDCSERTLYLLAGATCLKTYAVAVGPGGLTPRGRFEVLSKLKNPEWTNPETHDVVPFGHPENPLGTRWIAFTPGFGIHGTNDPASIGTATSKGCIRMHNRDAEEIYDFLVNGATVEVVD